MVYPSIQWRIWVQDGMFIMKFFNSPFQEDSHTEWVSAVRFSPNTANPIIVSAGWDKTVKVWNLTNCKLRTNHFGHNGYLNTVTVSPDGSLCASGGKDGLAMLWDLNDGKHLYTLDGGDIIEALCFSPNRYWLCAATGPIIKIWVRWSTAWFLDWKYVLTPECVNCFHDDNLPAHFEAYLTCENYLCFWKAVYTVLTSFFGCNNQSIKNIYSIWNIIYASFLHAI